MRRMTRDDPGFYECMRPLFGSRKVAKEVGLPMFDDDDKQWFMAFDDVLMGVASVRGSVVSDCYVFGPFRLQGVFSEILSAVMDGTTGGLVANCTPSSVRAFAKAGFHPISATKNFTRMGLNRA